MAVDVPRIVFLVCILLFLFVTPDTRAPTPSQQQELVDQIQVEKHALNILNQSSFGAFDPSRHQFLNLTGLRREDHYAWDLLPQFLEETKAHIRTVFASSSTAKANVTGDDYANRTMEDPQLSSDADDGFALSLHPFQEPSPFYQNLTGIVRGSWSKIKLNREVPILNRNISALAPGYVYTSPNYKRNITGLSGDLRVKLDEKKSRTLPSDPGLVREVKAEFLITDESSTGDGWDVVMFGIHYPQSGGVLLSTTSERFAGIFALPHFALSDAAFNLSQHLLNKTIQATIEDQEASFDGALNPWSSSPMTPSDSLFSSLQCEYIAYLQQHPIDTQSARLRDIEKELRFPTGNSLQSVPGLKMSAMIFSPDCGFMLESKGPPRFSPQDGLHLNGLKLEEYLQRARQAVIAFAMLIGGQLFLLKRQMRDTSTPSTRSRVSFYTIGIMAMGDGFVCMTEMVAAMFIDALFLPLIATAFLSFMCVSFFGMKFLMDIWTVQAPERREREREQQRGRDRANAASGRPNADASVDTSTNQASGTDTLPLPATARRTDNSTATTVILPPDQDLQGAEAEDANNATANQNATTPITAAGSARRELGALYSKFYFLLLTILFLSLHATTWPIYLRSLYCNILAFIYLSFWTPQIYRNIMRNCRKALRWEFVIGESILRLAPFAYFYTSENNVLFVEPDANVFYALTAWVWLQVWQLASQEILGPRFFVPNGWAPPAYDYHPVLRESDLGDGGESGALLPLGFTDSRVQDSDNATSVTGAEATTSSTVTTSSSAPVPVPASPTASRKKNKDGKRIFDCAICTEDIEVPVVTSSTGPSNGTRSSRADSASESTMTGLPTSTSAATTAASSAASAAAAALSTTLFSRRAYMVTPCRHIFHSTCLEGWMRYRLQCPICRETLPPL